MINEIKNKLKRNETKKKKKHTDILVNIIIDRLKVTVKVRG